MPLSFVISKELGVVDFSYCIHMHVPPPIGDTIFAVFGMCHPLPLWWPKKKNKEPQRNLRKKNNLLPVASSL